MAERGRPSAYTPEVAAEICRRLAEGQTLREICRDETMPSDSTVRAWALDDREGFSAQYAKGRETGYQVMADELIEIADDGSNDWMERKNKDGSTVEVENHEVLNRSSLRVDTRKWLLSKALPKVYGDRMALTGAEGAPPIAVADVTATESARRIAFLLQEAARKDDPK